MIKNSISTVLKARYPAIASSGMIPRLNSTNAVLKARSSAIASFGMIPKLNLNQPTWYLRHDHEFDHNGVEGMVINPTSMVLKAQSSAIVSLGMIMRPSVTYMPGKDEGSNLHVNKTACLGNGHAELPALVPCMCFEQNCAVHKAHCRIMRMHDAR